jgi:SAM-dependent methyltransferase
VVLEIFQPVLTQAEEYARSGDRAGALRALRQLPIDDFGQLLLAVPAQYAALSGLLPRMAEDKVQRDWTGATGQALLNQSVAFVRTLTSAYREYGGGDLADSHVLDFGCGWGRLLRLMLKYCEPDRLFGVDPWTEAIDLCRKDGVLAHLAVSDYVPAQLPFEGTNFDLAYAFSVFTHLSERTALKCLASLRARMTSRSLLAISIRPVEYWTFQSFWDKGYTPEQLAEAHHGNGYAFFPHNRTPIHGDITYGDTSISLQYITDRWTDWELAGIDHNSGDSYQVLVFLRPR